MDSINTVADLIEQLQELPPTANIRIYDNEYAIYTPLEDIEDHQGDIVLTY